MTLIKATYQITTSMMLGDSDNKSVVEIRPPSFKGALRFWWRALNWSKYKNLPELHKAESHLFGGDSNHGGQGVFLLSIPPHTLNKGNKASSIEEKNLQYLLIGVNGKLNPTNRETIKSGGRFEVELFCKPNATKTERNSLKDALLALGLFGSIGAKSRKGFGSLAIEKLDGEDFTCPTIKDYQTKGENLINRYLDSKNPVNRPPFTALSSESEWLYMADTHTEMADSYTTFLTSNQKGGNGKLEFGEPRKEHSSNVKKDRRSSPLIMHIHPIGSQFIANILFMPAIWSLAKPTGHKDYKLVKQYLKKNKKSNLWKAAT